MAVFKTINYQDITDLRNPESPKEFPREFSEWQVENKFLGTFREKTVGHERFTITHHRANMKGNFKIRHANEYLPSLMNICIGLNGYLGVNFGRSNLKTGLTENSYNTVYVNESNYDLCIHNAMDVVHIAVDLNYYISLLDESEKWSDLLKQKLIKKEVVFSHDNYLCPRMRIVISEIFKSPLMEGSLGKLMLEAKIMELVVLHLEHIRKTAQIERSCTLKKQDQDIFLAMRDYLDSTFARDHSLKDLGRRFGLNDFKLKMGFKQMFGTTVFEYIYHLRMEYSKKLLLDTEFAVSEVALLVGYKNPNHFSTAFKRKYGVKPACLKGKTKTQ